VNTREALWRCVLENPAEDGPRLALADFLEEIGKPAHVARAQFIRLQIERHQGSGGDVSIGRQLKVAEWSRQEEALLKKWGAGWLPAPLRVGFNDIVWRSQVAHFTTVWPLAYATFERGFVERLGFEIPTSSLEYVRAATDTLGNVVRDVFASQPLCGVSISFAMQPGGDFPDFHAEIVPAVQGATAQFWRIGWDRESYERAGHDMIMHPVFHEGRAELGRSIPLWFLRALDLPAAQAFDWAEMQRAEPIEVPDAWPTEVEMAEYNERQQGLMDEVMRGMGISPELMRPPGATSPTGPT
jgi:uncharacterized protein (TIGR02996 family)